MALETRLVELEKRHRALEKQIETEALAPSSSDVTVREMKRRKLHLKEEIERVRTSLSTRTH